MIEAGHLARLNLSKNLVELAARRPFSTGVAAKGVTGHAK